MLAITANVQPAINGILKCTIELTRVKSLSDAPTVRRLFLNLITREDMKELIQERGLSNARIVRRLSASVALRKSMKGPIKEKNFSSARFKINLLPAL